MTDKPDFLRIPLYFDSKGKIESSEATLREVSDKLTDNTITDLIVLSHGWNENETSATELYDYLLGHIQTAMQGTSLCANRKFGVVEVFWPSQIRFFWESRAASGVAASSGASDSMQQVVNQLNVFFDDDPHKQKKLQEAYKAVARLEDDSRAATRFIQLFNELLKTDQNVALEPIDDWLMDLDPNKGKELLEQLQIMPINVSNRQHENAASIHKQEKYDGFESSVAAMSGLGIGGLKNGAKWLLTKLTYRKMRERANVVGSIGLNDALHQLRQQHSELKLHLIGHSFGALLVTSAVLGPDRQKPVSIDSLTLLQAAFSHYSFAKGYDGGDLDGVFRPVLDQVKGPILVSHTRNDLAVGAAYALASKITGQVASNIIEEVINDMAGSSGFYGGLGFNGARMTPESSDEFCLSKEAGVSNFKPKTVYNLNADTLIMGHSKLDHLEIAQAILSAIAAT